MTKNKTRTCRIRYAAKNPDICRKERTNAVADPDTDYLVVVGQAELPVGNPKNGVWNIAAICHHNSQVDEIEAVAAEFAKSSDIVANFEVASMRGFANAADAMILRHSMRSNPGDYEFVVEFDDLERGTSSSFAADVSHEKIRSILSGFAGTHGAKEARFDVRVV